MNEFCKLVEQYESFTHKIHIRLIRQGIFDRPNGYKVEYSRFPDQTIGCFAIEAYSFEDALHSFIDSPSMS